MLMKRYLSLGIPKGIPFFGRVVLTVVNIKRREEKDKRKDKRKEERKVYVVYPKKE